MRTKFFAAAIGIFAGVCIGHGHLHFVAGTATPAPGAKLLAVNSNDFVLETGYVRTMTRATTGRLAGFWAVDHPFTVAGAAPPPEEGAPALGSWIHMGMVSLSGPAGGEVGYWEVGATAPTIRLRVGERGTNLWRISENNGAPGSDPYGHIHGRNFTATKPGLYIIGFQFVDLSTNGVGGGPLHVPSDIIPVAFQAGITLSEPMKQTNEFRARVGTQLGRAHTLEYATNLAANATWTIGDSVSGDDHFQVLIDDNPKGEMRFYRVRNAVE